MVTRLSIDRMRSARARREEYVGPWLPEPLVSEGDEDAGDPTELDESLSMAFLVLLKSLNPVERAVFLLHVIFDYDYGEITRIVGKNEANCRQIARRARQSVAARRPRFDRSPEQGEQLTRQFVEACTSGDMEGLLGLLFEDVTLWSDGGGKVAAAPYPIYGPERVARFLLGVLRTVPPGFFARLTQVNGGPGVVCYVDGAPRAWSPLDVADGRLRDIRIVVNPEKLQTIPTPLQISKHSIRGKEAKDGADRQRSRPRGGPFRRFAYGLSRRPFSQVAEPLTVMAHHPKLLLGYGMLEVTFERSELGDDYLKGLAVLKAATMIAREFCKDIGSDLSRAGGVTEEQLRGSPDYERSETFSPLEKLMVRYAAAVVRMPADAAEEFFDALREHFSETQVVELTAAIALQNYRVRFNHAFGM
jgi:RNA polymerase sigma-70 factor, ECF subfamily